MAKRTLTAIVCLIDGPFHFRVQALRCYRRPEQSKDAKDSTRAGGQPSKVMAILNNNIARVVVVVLDVGGRTHTKQVLKGKEAVFDPLGI